MSALTTRAVAPLPRMLAKQTWSSILGLWRIPAFSISGLMFPVILFVFFGLPNVNRTVAGVNAGAYILASFGAYAVGSLMVFNFGIGIAQERAQKLDLLMRATPLPASIYLASRIITAAVFGTLALLLLFAFGTIAGGIRLGPEVWLSIIVRLLVGSLPFIGLGFAIGYASGANAAPALANLIYLPLSFASGLFIPASELPDVVQKVAPYLPTYHYGQLAWNAVGVRTESLATSFLWLGGYAVLFIGIALRAYRRESTRKFG